MVGTGSTNAIDRKPECGCEFLKFHDAQSRIMMQLKVVNDDKDEE